MKPILLFLMLTFVAAYSHASEVNFQKAKAKILEKFVDPSLTEDTLYQYALQGMLNGLNQKHPEWNKWYSGTEYEQLHSELSGKIVGVGIEISFESAAVNVLSVLPHSPAEKVGIKASDKIIQIEGKSLKGLTLSEIVRRLRGKVGDSVRLTWLRGGTVFNETIVRVE